MQTITGSVLRSLSGGECKLWLALLLAPDADTSRLAQITGYSESQVRRLRNKLNAAQGLPPAQGAAIKVEQTPLVKQMIALGVRPDRARRLASSAPDRVIKYALGKTHRMRDHLDNPAGYLVSLIQSEARARGCWSVGESADVPEARGE